MSAPSLHRKPEPGPPTRAALALARKRADDSRRERDAALIQLENAEKLLSERGVDALLEERDALAKIVARLKVELATADPVLLARGPEILDRWRTTLLASIPEKGAAS